VVKLDKRALLPSGARYLSSWCSQAEREHRVLPRPFSVNFSSTFSESCASCMNLSFTIYKIEAEVSKALSQSASVNILEKKECESTR
jgi:hypothetical protein